MITLLQHARRSWPGLLLRSGVSVFPLTIQGVATLLLAGLVLQVYAYGALDLIVFAIAICALAILIVCLFCTVGSGLLLQRRVLRLEQDRLIASKEKAFEAGYPNETGFKIPALRYLPLVKLSWRVIYPDFIDSRMFVSADNELCEEVLPSRRCLSKHTVRRFEVSDVLGLCRFSWKQTEQPGCFVLPKINTLKPLPILRSLTSEDGIPSSSGEPEGDRMEIRPYVAGDSVRNIMWKAYARNRQLSVRLPERSVFQSRRTLAYLLSSESDEAAAATARMALESGVLGEEWTFAADGSNTSCNTVDAALHVLAGSRGIGESHDYGLDDFLAREGGLNQAHCILFAAAEMASWLTPLKQSMARNPGQFSIILASDGFREESRKSLIQRLIFRVKDTDTAAAGREDLARLLLELGQSAQSVILVDRMTGNCFDQQLRKI